MHLGDKNQNTILFSFYEIPNGGEERGFRGQTYYGIAKNRLNFVKNKLKKMESMPPISHHPQQM